MNCQGLVIPFSASNTHIMALAGLGKASAQQQASSSEVDLSFTKPVRATKFTKMLEPITRQGLMWRDTPVVHGPWRGSRMALIQIQ